MKISARRISAAAVASLMLIGVAPGIAYADEAVAEQTPIAADQNQSAAAAATISQLKASTTDLEPGEAQEDVKQVSDSIYTQKFENNISAIYNAHQDKALWINTNAISAYLGNISSYGKYLWTNEVRSEGGKTTLITYFLNEANESDFNSSTQGFGILSAPDQKALFKYRVQPMIQDGEYIAYHGELPQLVGGFPNSLLGRDYNSQATVDTTYDWSQATFIQLQKVLEYTTDSGDTWYIQATSKGTPLPGAKPVKSNALGKSATYADRAQLSDYNTWATGGSYNMYEDLTMLGAPTGAETESVEDGQAVVVQQFEGGQLTWYKGTEHLSAELNANGQAKKTWYESLNF